MILRIGATIRCRDGEAGRLNYVVIDPEDGAVTHLIIGPRGLPGMLLHHDIVVPAAWVERSSEQEIVLNATVAELNELPEYREVDYIQPDPSYRPVSGHRIEETRFWAGPYLDVLIVSGRPWSLRHVRLGIEDEEVVLQRGLPVQDRDGRTVGTLDHLVVDPASRRVIHLVVRQGSGGVPLLGAFWARQARIVPLERVATVTDYGLRLDMPKEELDHAPLYQPPASDAEITAGLQRALETDPRTRDAGLRVHVQDGVVRFIGTMTEAVMQAARSIARRIRGVIGFEDEIRALPFPPLRIGAPVHALDGRYGTLAKVVVDPYTRRVTHLVVRKGWLLIEDRVLPIERVARVQPDGIYLDAPAVELDQHPPYREEVFVEPLPGWEEVAPYVLANTLFWGPPYIGVTPPVIPVVEHRITVGVPEHDVVLRRDIDVIYDDDSENGGVVGSLDHMLIDPESGEISHLVVRESGRRRRVIVPIEWVRKFEAEAIVLDQWNPDQPGAPAYESTPDDAAMTADLKSRLQANPALNAVQVQVAQGVAYLFGHVEGEADQVAADAIARSTPGVQDVDNALSPDDALFGRVTAELLADPRLEEIPIEVIADRGTITLKGVVPSQEVKRAAEAITRRVPGVVAVINELEIRPKEPALDPGGAPARVIFVPPVRN